MEFMAFIGIYFMFGVQGFFPFRIEVLYLMYSAWGSVLQYGIVVVRSGEGNCHCVWLAVVACSCGRSRGTGGKHGLAAGGRERWRQGPYKMGNAAPNRIILSRITILVYLLDNRVNWKKQNLRQWVLWGNRGRHQG